MIDKLTNVINKCVEFLLVVLFAALLIIGALQIISRYFFDLPIVWADEASKYLFVYMSMIGAAYAVHLNKHVAADVVLTKLNSKGKWIIEFIIDLLSIFLFCALIYLAPKMISLSGTTISATLNIPMSYVYMSMLIGPVLMLYYKVVEMIKKYSHKKD